MAKRLKRGRDWHAWAFKAADPDLKGLLYWAEPERPDKRPTDAGKWVRVKFVEMRKAKP